MLLMYDLEDNYICEFNNYKECAKYFNTTVKCLYCYISRSKKGIVDKKRDYKNKRWVRLFRNNQESERRIDYEFKNFY